METISNETILKLKESIQAKEGQSSYSNGYHKIDVPGYLQHYQIAYSIKQNGTGTIYRLNNCVFDSSHTTNEASIIQDAMGKLYYQCFHNSCKGRTWVEARELISGKDSLKPFMPGAETIMQNFNVAKQLIQDESEKKYTEILSSLETWNSIRALDITIEWIVDRLIPKDSKPLS